MFPTHVKTFYVCRFFSTFTRLDFSDTCRSFCLHIQNLCLHVEEVFFARDEKSFYACRQREISLLEPSGDCGNHYITVLLPLVQILTCKAWSLFELDFFTHQYATRFSVKKHCLQLVDPCKQQKNKRLNRSIYGLVVFWNALPCEVALAPSVKCFQWYLTNEAKNAVKLGSSIQDLCALKFVHVPYDNL